MPDKMKTKDIFMTSQAEIGNCGTWLSQIFFMVSGAMGESIEPPFLSFSGNSIATSSQHA